MLLFLPLIAVITVRIVFFRSRTFSQNLVSTSEDHSFTAGMHDVHCTLIELLNAFLATRFLKFTFHMESNDK